MTLEEFSKLLHKRNLDIYLPRDDQRLVFELFDKNHAVTIKVGDLLEYVKVDPNQTLLPSPSSNLVEIKANITAKLAQRRNAAKLADSARQMDQQLQRDLRSLDPDSTGYLSKETFKVSAAPHRQLTFIDL